jgi:hypothetical protein
VPVLDRRLLKLEANRPPPPPMSREESEQRINELLAKVGSSLAQEIERHGSIGAIIRSLKCG